MPIGPPISEAPLNYTVNDIINDALIEIGVASPSDPADNETVQWAFRKLNDVMDTWQAMRNKVWSHAFTVFTFQANTNPVVMGPSPAATPGWSVPQRPVRIERAA